MVAFEIAVNGKPLYTIGVGDFGSVSVGMLWSRVRHISGSVVESAFLHGLGGKDINRACRHLLWPTTDLQIGDEITVRLIETDTIDPPSEDRLADD